MPHQFGQQLRHVWLNLYFTMGRTKLVGYSLGIGQFIIIIRNLAASIADTVRVERPVRPVRHQGRDRAGVNTATKECTDWNVTDHVRMNGAVQLVPDTVYPLLVISRCVRFSRR